MLSFFGFCNIHILNTSCAKILKKISAPKCKTLQRYKQDSGSLVTIPNSYISGKQRIIMADNVRITQQWADFVQPLLQWKSNEYYILWACTCSLRYPARIAHAPYYIIICGLSGRKIFFHIISQTPRCSKKKLLNINCVLCFSLYIFSETFLTLRRNERYMIVNVYRSSLTVPVILDTC